MPYDEGLHLKARAHNRPWEVCGQICDAVTLQSRRRTPSSRISYIEEQVPPKVTKTIRAEGGIYTSRAPEEVEPNGRVYWRDEVKAVSKKHDKAWNKSSKA